MTTLLMAFCLQPQDPLERLKDVRDHIVANRFDEALGVLNEIRSKAGPNGKVDALRAMVLNRLDRHHEADEVATDLIGREPSNADAHFERGVSRLERARFEEAKSDFERALEFGFKDTGLAKSLLARAEAGLGNLARAQDLLAQAADELDREGGAYGAVSRWQNQLADLTARRRDERYGLKLTLGTGWTSNALRLNEGVTGVAGVSSRKSAFFSGRLQGFYNIVHEPETRLAVSAAPEYRWYDRARGVSYFTVPVRADVAHLLDDEVVGRLGLRYQPAWIFSPDRRLNSTYAAEPSVTWLWADWARTTFAGEVGWTKYALSGLTGARNPDATFWGMDVRQSFDLDDAKTVALYPSVGYKRNSARGSDYDYDSLEAALTLEWKATDDFRIAGGVQLLWSWYDNAHSLSTTASHRRDFLVLPFVSATYDATDWFSITLTGSRLNADSTVEVFDYSATDVSLLFGFDLIALADEIGDDE